ncbi:MAG: hypothetical protein KDD66_06540 [Bdellovibrionales bacterium]|nr:hypothetical protein [Bdellovibrionales bacterium]
MKGNKVQKFMQLGGQEVAVELDMRDERTRKLGAQLLLTEVLEYVIKGLQVTPIIKGTKVEDPNDVQFEVNGEPDAVEMLDGLADVAYTMYWNALAFGLPLEEGFDLVCDNNLEKFVQLEGWTSAPGPVEQGKWDCGEGAEWPEEVAHVEVIKIDEEHFAVGKDSTGKVRKPVSFRSVQLSHLVAGGN